MEDVDKEAACRYHSEGEGVGEGRVWEGVGGAPAVPWLTSNLLGIFW